MPDARRDSQPLEGEPAARVLVAGASGFAGALSAQLVWRHPRLDTDDTHGTGCTLSAAIAAGLARGRDLETAVDHAIEFVAAALARAPGLGKGHGPLDHFAPLPSEAVLD